MRKAELQNRIEELLGLMGAYRALLVESRDLVMPCIVRNGQRLEKMRNDLNRGYGSVSEHISKLGGDGRQFQIALSATELPRRGPHIDVALQILEQILGRLEHTSDDEFDSIFALQQPETRAPGIIAASGGGGGGGGGPGGGRGGDGGGVVIGIPPEQIGIQHVRDPHKQYWRKVAIDLWGWFQQHILTAVIVGLIIAGLVYWLGWD